jgi:D-tyrosyl-tRNA(Tyr) deacylase
LLVLVGVGIDDTEVDVDRVAQRILKLRLWPNSENQQWKQNVVDLNGEVICVSQFTLFGNIKKGAKPDFHNAAKGPRAQELYNQVLEKVKEGLPCGEVGDGVFGAMMDVALVNDGPVTIEYDTKKE